MNRSDCVRITHQPSGEEVVVAMYCSKRRTARDAKEAAMQVLRSRLWAEAHGLGRRDSLVRTVEVDWDFYSPFPFDITL